MGFELQHPKISVIVPVHNGRDFLEACADSILAQTYPELEVILVEDGSTDDSLQICERLCSAHENFSMIEIPDLGVSAARNLGIAAAQGEYITFVDADDRIHPQMLEVLQSSLEETKSDLAGCSFFAWQTESDWEAAVQKLSEQYEKQEYETNVSDAEQFVFEGILKNNTRCWSKLYRRSCFETVSFREGLTIGEDMMLLVDLAPHVKKTASVNFAGYGYFQNPAGAMNRKFKPGYMDQIRCWKLAREVLVQWAAGNERLTKQQKRSAEQITSARLMVGIMLTVGKLAELPKKERRAYGAQIQTCRQELKRCLQEKNGLELLDRGYRIKVRAFGTAPGLYLGLYGLMRRIKKS